MRFQSIGTGTTASRCPPNACERANNKVACTTALVRLRTLSSSGKVDRVRFPRFRRSPCMLARLTCLLSFVLYNLQYVVLMQVQEDLIGSRLPEMSRTNQGPTTNPSTPVTETQPATIASASTTAQLVPPNIQQPHTQSARNPARSRPTTRKSKGLLDFPSAIGREARSPTGRRTWFRRHVVQRTVLRGHPPSETLGNERSRMKSTR
jgi:hypothetical protein